MEVRGNGCVIKDLFGKQQIKASELGREYSKGDLEKRLGSFRPGTAMNDTEPVLDIATRSVAGFGKNS